MKLSLNWIRDFVNLDGIETDEIVKRLGLVTCEIEGVFPKGRVSGAVVGRIVTCKKHPERDRLNILTVDNGTEIVDVICGAPNCRAGLTVAFAKVGSVIGDMTVDVATIAGVVSHGMCMSERELSLSADHDGIIELGDTLVPGTDLHVALPFLRDTVIEIDNKSLTNRPDLWGHYGFARELGAIFSRELTPIDTGVLDKYKGLPALDIEIENAEACYSFGAIRIENVQRRTSPVQMRARLFYCDISSHGFLVDLSNYIMLELGQPNHAFDMGKVGKLSVGNVKEGTNFTTLKDQTIAAKADTLFIKSDGVPVSLAGIMGGAATQITPETTAAIFEIATFDATNIRKSSATLGIRSDSSTRYEKSLDPELNFAAAARIVQLVTSLDKGARVTSRFSRKETKQIQTPQITLSKDYLTRFAGVKFDFDKVGANLAALGFAPKITEHDITVTVPTWRATKDISGRADIIEEIVRTFGYDNIQPTPPRRVLAPVARDAKLVAIERIKDILVDTYDMTEVHTYIWNSRAAMCELGIETPSHLRITNACSGRDSENIRSEMAPSLLAAIAKNKQINDIAIFEVARTYTPDGERTVLCVALANHGTGGEVYANLAHVIRDTMAILGIEAKFQIGAAPRRYFHPKNNASLQVAGKTAGAIGLVHPSVAEKIDAHASVAVVELTLDDLFTQKVATKKMKSSKFPTTTLDFTFQLKGFFGEFAEHFSSFLHEFFINYCLKDIFGDKYTLEFKIGSASKTLENADVQSVWSAIVAHARLGGWSVATEPELMPC